MKIPLGFWKPEPGEPEEDFDQRVFDEMTAAIASMSNRDEAAESDATPGATLEPGGAA